MVIGSAHSYSWQYSIQNQMLEPADEVKDLGILIDSSLKFNSHIDSIVAKAHLRASLIHKCFVSKHHHHHQSLCSFSLITDWLHSQLTPALLTRAFKVYVRPIVEYASCVWSPHYGYAIDKVESVQRRFEVQRGLDSNASFQAQNSPFPQIFSTIVC